MKHILCRLAVVITVTILPSILNAETVPFSDDRWTLVGDDTERLNYRGQDALYTSAGGAFLKGADFKDGIIEVDIIFPNDMRGFSGATWRMQQDGSYEHFYIRPHLSNKTDSSQYTPVFKHDTGWQLYFGPGHSVALEVKYNKWMHLKIVVSGDRAEVYVDSEEPVLYIDDLKADLPSGDIGVSTTFAPAYYANFSYEKIDSPELTDSAPPAQQRDENLIKQYALSDVLDDNDTNPAHYSGPWTNHKIEDMGAINISRHRHRHGDHNSVLVRMQISSETDQIKKFTFGYSDDVTVYMNGNPISGGSNIYQSRDYRYLGTIGLFDHVYLPLKKGENDVYFAVREYFGGWGFMGKFEDMSGIKVE